MDRVIKAIANAVKDIYKKEIKDSYNRSLKFLSEQMLISYERNVIDELFDDLLRYHTWRICQKTFIYEFHKYRKSLSLPVDVASNKAFNSYIQQIDRETVKSWMVEYKVLKSMLTNIVNNTCKFVEEVSFNFKSDVQQLCKYKLLEQDANLKSIIPLNSDPHNESKIALCFKFEHGDKIVYKPRSLELDMIIDKIFTEILKFDVMPYLSPVVPTFSRESYGWQKFVRKELVEKEHVGEAYYNLGICAAVFAALGATDLHDENIIFYNTMPYFIDLETSLKPDFEDEDNSILNLMNDIIKHSVISTSILPAKMPTIPHRILIGAINTPYPQKMQEKVFGIKNWGTDAVDFARMNMEVSHCSHSLTLKDEITPDPLPFQEEFLEGYETGYHEIMLKKEQIIDLLSTSKCRTRVIVRPTTQYALMLDAILFPEYLADENIVDQVLDYMKETKLIRKENVAKSILEQEKKSLKNGDIPYFSVKENDTCMTAIDYISEEAFNITPIKNAIRTLNKLSENRLICDKRLIAEGYSEIRVHEAKVLEVKNIGHISPVFTKVIDELTKGNLGALITLIIALVIENDQEAGWLNGIYGDSPISYDSNGFISFHDTGGIVLLLERLTEYGEKNNYERYVSLLCKMKNAINSLGVGTKIKLDENSIIAGLSSLEYICNHSAKRLPKTEKIMRHWKKESAVLDDVFSGGMGKILVLSTFTETQKDILKNAYTNLQNYDTKSFSKEGIAHGELGKIWTEFRVNIALGNGKIAEKLYEKSLEYRLEMSGWCNGNAGLLMILAEMGKVLGRRENLYDIALKALQLSEKDPVDLSICHGGAGVLQAILFTYAITKDSWYFLAAEKYCNRLLQIANNNGFYTGENNRDYLMGYFLGWSGLADSILLLNIFREGKISSFPLNLSSDDYQKKLFKEGMYEMFSCD